MLRISPSVCPSPRLQVEAPNCPSSFATQAGFRRSRWETHVVADLLEIFSEGHKRLTSEQPPLLDSNALCKIPFGKERGETGVHGVIIDPDVLIRDKSFDRAGYVGARTLVILQQRLASKTQGDDRNCDQLGISDNLSGNWALPGLVAGQRMDQYYSVGDHLHNDYLGQSCHAGPI